MYFSDKSTFCDQQFPHCSASLFDSDTDTMWMAVDNQLPQFISWDTDRVLTVESIRLISRDGRIGRAGLLYSNQGIYGVWNVVRITFTLCHYCVGRGPGFLAHFRAVSLTRTILQLQQVYTTNNYRAFTWSEVSIVHQNINSFASFVGADV